jgi:glutamyl-tRNA reductase
VTSETGLGAAGRSLMSSALDLLEQRGFAVKGKSVLVIGTGAYARVVIAALERADARTIYVYSPSGRAELFSATHPTTPVSEGEFESRINEVDFIVACSGTHGTVVEAGHLAPRSPKLPIVDLSLSSDIAHDVKQLDFVELIDLAEIHRNAPAEHQETIELARSIISEAVDEFQRDLVSRVNDPLVKALRAHVSEIVEKEVERVRRKSGEEIAAQVERSLALVTKTIFHKPTIHAKSSAVSGDTDEYQKAIEVLFGFNVDQESSDD